MVFKRGDRVKILRASTEEEDRTLWKNRWAWDMNYIIGKVATVDSITEYGIVFKERKENRHFDYRFPPFVLQKVHEQMLFPFMKE